MPKKGKLYAETKEMYEGMSKKDMGKMSKKMKKKKRMMMEEKGE